MALSQSPATLNRFPGLQLKAWALFSGSTLLAGSNMTSVVLAGSQFTFTMTQSIGSVNYVVDVIVPKPAFSIGVTSGTVFAVTPNDFAGAAVSLGGAVGFVAVYAP